MSRRMLRTAGRKLALAALLGTYALACSPQTSAAVGVFEVRKVISAPGVPSEADKKLILSYMDPFFRQFLKPADGLTVPNLRKDYGNIVRGVGKTPGHDFLNATTYRYADAILRGKFSPAAKYNAMLMLADLNESDVPGAIKPYRDALIAMGKALAAPESDADYLKAAALIGITRLAEEKALPPNLVNPIAGMLLKILTDADPPSGRSASAHNFMRRSAAKALAAIGSPGPNNQVVTEIRSIMLDPNSKLTMRCEMAQLFNQLIIPPEAKVDYTDLANLIGHQTVEISEQEFLRATEEKRDPSRRIVLYALKSADLGLDGLGDSAAKDETASKFISKIRGKFSQLYNQLDDVSKTPDSKLAETAMPALEEIRDMLNPKPEPEVTPTPPPAATETAARPAN